MYLHSSKKGSSPVIAGFVGKTKDGKITTLGRGGSDTTAFLLAQGINANQVVLVTDADGIMSSDPKIISSPKLLSTIDVNTLVGLADSGAKFIHSKALKYKPKDIDVKVISNAHGDLSRAGTIITGGLATNLMQKAHQQRLKLNGMSHPEVITEMVKKVKKLKQLTYREQTQFSILPQKENIYTLQPTTKSQSAQRNHSKSRQANLVLHQRCRRETTYNYRISEGLRVNGINIQVLTITSSILLL
jgi:aspartate kinase